MKLFYAVAAAWLIAPPVLAEAVVLGPPLGMELSAVKKLKAKDNPQAHVICSDDNVDKATIDSFTLAELMEMFGPPGVTAKCSWFEPDGAGLKLSTIRVAGSEATVTYEFRDTKPLFEPTLVKSFAISEMENYKAVLSAFKSQLGKPSRHDSPDGDSGNRDQWKLDSGASAQISENLLGNGKLTHSYFLEEFEDLVAALDGPGIASAAEGFELRIKEGVSNIRLQVKMERDTQVCTPEVLAELKSKIVAVAQAYFKSRIDQFRKNAGSDASGKGEYFRADYLARCDNDGRSAWFKSSGEGTDQYAYHPPESWKCYPENFEGECKAE